MSFPRYPKYKPSGVAWLGDVPEHWQVKPLKAAASFNDDVLSENFGPYEEIQYVDIGSVSLEGGIERTESFIYKNAPSRARRKVKDGDVIASTVRTYLKAIAPVINPPENLIVSTGFAVIRPSHGLTPVFAKYSLQSSYFIDEVISRSTGISYPAINASEMAGISLALPPLPEQTAIAAFLDSETAKIDSLVEEQRGLIGLLKEKRQAVISHAVTRGLDPKAKLKDSGVEWLGMVPKQWEVLRIANVFREVIEAGTDDLPILSVSIHDGVSDKEFTEDEQDRKVTRSDDRSKYKKVAPGDLVYNMMRAWQGGFGAVTVAGMVSPAYVVARPIRPLVTAFIEHLLRTPQAIEQMRRHSRGITDFRLRLYWDEFKNINIALPPKDEAISICAKIAEMNAEFDAVAAACEETIALLQERRSALISAAVTGQIDVRNH